MSVDRVEPKATPDHTTLDLVKRGDVMVVLSVDDANARIHALRFGMAEGACVSCVTKIPAGPIVLKSGRQEIAVGRELAKRIKVQKLHDGAAGTGKGH